MKTNVLFLFCVQSLALIAHGGQVDHSNSVETSSTLDVGVQKKESLKILESKAKNGDSDAQCELSLLYGKGEKVATDFDKAFYWAEQAAQRDNPKAYGILFTCYLKGSGCERDLDKAVEVLRKGAEAGNAQCQGNLALLLYSGEAGVKKDPGQAVRWALKSVEQGNAIGTKVLGYAYLSGIGAKQDIPQGLQYLEKASQGLKEPSTYVELGEIYLSLKRAGNPAGDLKKSEECFKQASKLGDENAEQRYLKIRQFCDNVAELEQRLAKEGPKEEILYKLGVCYFDGVEGAPLDAPKGLALIEESAKMESPDALNLLAWLYITGRGKERDVDKALELLQKGASMGSSLVKETLGSLLISGDYGVNRDVEKGLKWLRESAEQNNVSAQYNLGQILLLGMHGVGKDEKEGIRWLQKSAEGNFALAQYVLGCCYVKGIGVEKNTEKGIRLVYAAAMQNQREAQYSLGCSNRDGGEGQPKNYQEAARWMEMSAKQGHVDAQYSLGQMYEEGGYGLAPDLLKARAWYHQAAQRGHKGAQLALKRIMEEGPAIGTVKE